jgi:MoaA/NifB/PqqE/SkfB family radical SAM enzyme
MLGKVEHASAPLPRLSYKRLLRSAGLLVRYGNARKLANLARAEIAWRRRLTRLDTQPYLFRVDPTSRCNLACPYCGRTVFGPLPVHTLAWDDFVAGFTPFAPWCLLVSFQMFGEPTLNDALPRMIEYAHRQRCATYLSTNLQAVDESGIERLLESRLDVLTVAVDAATPETYRLMKPGGDFNRLLKSLDELFTRRRAIRRPPLVGFQVLVTRHNEPELGAIRDLAHRLGADFFDLKPTGFLPDASWRPAQPRYQIERYMRPTTVCAMPWVSLTLLANGRYFPCCAVPREFDLGPIGDNPITRIWNGEPLHAVRRGLATGILHPLCRDCQIGRLPVF